jgi:hypothetical protein
MSERHIPRRVENYTRPFLAMTCLILFMGFWTIAATLGYIAVLVSAAVIDLSVQALGLAGQRRARARAPGSTQM